jgi:hypothetical protein
MKCQKEMVDEMALEFEYSENSKLVYCTYIPEGSNAISLKTDILNKDILVLGRTFNLKKDYLISLEEGSINDYGFKFLVATKKIITIMNLIMKFLNMIIPFLFMNR